MDVQVIDDEALKGERGGVKNVLAFRKDGVNDLERCLLVRRFGRGGEGSETRLFLGYERVKMTLPGHVFIEGNSIKPIGMVPALALLFQVRNLSLEPFAFILRWRLLALTLTFF